MLAGISFAADSEPEASDDPDTGRVPNTAASFARAFSRVLDQPVAVTNSRKSALVRLHLQRLLCKEGQEIASLSDVADVPLSADRLSTTPSSAKQASSRTILKMSQHITCGKV